MKRIVEPEIKPSNIISWLLGILGGSATVGLIIFCVKYFGPTVVVDPCQRYLEKIRTEAKIKYQSAATDYYHSIKYKQEIDARSLDTIAIAEDFFKKVQLPSFYDNFGDLQNKMIVPVNEQLLLEYLKQANESNQLITSDEISGSLITLREKIDFGIAGICNFNYNVELLTPKRIKDIFPKGIYDAISRALSLCPEFKRLSQRPVNAQVNLSEIYKCLESNEEFKKDIKKLAQFNKAFFRVVDTGLDWLIDEKSFYFDSGEYNISGVYAMIIDRLISEYAKYIRNNPGDYLITCTGFTDDKKIREKARIPYNSFGHFRRDMEPIPFSNGVSLAGEKIPQFIDNKNGGNNSLGYARSFSGIKYIAQNFDQQLLNDSRQSIEFEYNGGGVDNSAAKDKYKRRIEVTLEKIELQ